MKLQVKYLFPCEYANTDSYGKINASAIFRTIQKPENLPTLLFSFYVAGALIPDSNPEDVTIQLLDPSKKVISEARLSPIINNLGEKRGNRISIVAKLNAEFSTVGEYGLNILIGGENVYNDSSFVSFENK